VTAGAWARPQDRPGVEVRRGEVSSGPLLPSPGGGCRCLVGGVGRGIGVVVVCGWLGDWWGGGGGGGGAGVGGGGGGEVGGEGFVCCGGWVVCVGCGLCVRGLVWGGVVGSCGGVLAGQVEGEMGGWGVVGVGGGDGWGEGGELRWRVGG